VNAELISLTPAQALGIPVALVGAVFLAGGAEFQQHGVNKVEEATRSKKRTGLRIGQLLALARRPSWLIGTLMLGLAIVLQLISLYLAPLTVVQPLGAIALVITAIANARVSKTKLDAAHIRAIVFCVGGIGVFVTVAAATTTTVPIDDFQLAVVLAILGSAFLILGAGFLVFRKRLGRLFYVAGAGVLFGFVATIAKVLIARIQTILRTGFHLTPADWLTVVCLAGLLAAAALGSYFVQTAYSSGSPDVVVAGLTVIDPLVGVTIGIVVLGEASAAPLWAGLVFVGAGLLAVYGVLRLSRRPPRALSLAPPRG
jgi:drug/metabolite transporter (DMT)-like permease